MHWCGDEYRLLAWVVGDCNWHCAVRAVRYKLRSIERDWWGLTSVQRQNIVWFAVWCLTVIWLS